jgi:hypothetical protein
VGWGVLRSMATASGYFLYGVFVAVIVIVGEGVGVSLPDDAGVLVAFGVLDTLGVLEGMGVSDGLGVYVGVTMVLRCSSAVLRISGVIASAGIDSRVFQSAIASP